MATDRKTLEEQIARFEQRGVEGVKDDINGNRYQDLTLERAKTWLDSKRREEEREISRSLVDAAHRSANAAERSAETTAISNRIAMIAVLCAVVSALAAMSQCSMAS